jgi:hypothetical protein
MQHSISVEPNGSIDVIDLSNEGIKQISSFVGGFLDHKQLLSNLTLWISSGEQDKRQNENCVASAIVKEAGLNFTVYGNCVFTGGLDEKQESPKQLSPGWIKSIYLTSI